MAQKAYNRTVQILCTPFTLLRRNVYGFRIAVGYIYGHASWLWEKGRRDECFLCWRAKAPPSRGVDGASLAKATASENCVLLSPSATAVIAPTGETTKVAARKEAAEPYIVGLIYGSSAAAVVRCVSPLPSRYPNGRAASPFSLPPHFCLSSPFMSVCRACALGYRRWPCA